MFPQQSDPRDLLNHAPRSSLHEDEILDGTQDPYHNCENRCNHDLVRGVLVEELLGGDGPYDVQSLAAQVLTMRDNHLALTQPHTPDE